MRRREAWLLDVAMGMQKVAGDLVGVPGDADATVLDMSGSCGAESRAQARRIMTPQSEYPIFTPSFREAGEADSQSRPSFQDSDGQSIWKEIHTDTQSTASHSSHSISFEPCHLRTPTVSTTSLQNSPYADYMEPPALHSPTTSTTTLNHLLGTPPLPARNYNIPNSPHSPQNVNILSPQLRPLEKSSKRTQMRIASPRLNENGGLTPVVNQLTPNPEPQQPTRPGYDLPSTISPPATITRPPAAAVDHSPRPPLYKDRSRGTASPAFQSVRNENQSVRGMTPEMDGSKFQRLKARASAAAAVPSRHGSVHSAPVNLSNTQEYSGETTYERAADVVNRTGGKKGPSTQKSGSYKIFNFLSWGRKKSRDGGGATLKTESFLDSDLGNVKANSTSSKVLDYTIKTLRYKLEQANQQRAAAIEEIRALQAAVEASSEECRMLSQRCQESELKLSARSSGLWDMVEPEDQSPTYIAGRRELTFLSARQFSSQELMPEQFLQVFEDSIASLRKLASTICTEIREMGESATKVITALLEQHKVRRAIGRMPRNVIILYFESFLSQVMFESFENVSFEPNGASSVIDPDTLKQTCYQSYQNLKNQDWPTIEKSLGKPGALVVDTNFHRFFVVRMELIFSQLGKLAENEISLNLMAAFFNSVKAVWLVHHMAFAFDQPASIFRVSPGADFDARFMDHVMLFDHDPEPTARSKISVMPNPGFIVNRQIIKCQVYCNSKFD